MERDLIRKIKELEAIKPSAEWMDTTRYKLITQIELDKRADVMGVGFFQWLKQPQSFALAVCLIFIFLGGPWLTLQASKASLPGELLYSVKKATEGVQITVTSADSLTPLKMEFASRRLEELNKISEDSSTSGEKVKEVVSELKSNLEEASVYADKISEDKVIAVAKKAQKIKQDLGNTKEEVSSEVQTELAEAEKAVEQINEQILAALIKKKQQESGDMATTTTDQEILIFLEELEDGTITTTDKVINGE